MIKRGILYYHQYTYLHYESELSQTPSSPDRLPDIHKYLGFFGRLV